MTDQIQFTQQNAGFDPSQFQQPLQQPPPPPPPPATYGQYVPQQAPPPAPYVPQQAPPPAPYVPQQAPPPAPYVPQQAPPPAPYVPQQAPPPAPYGQYPPGYYAGQVPPTYPYPPPVYGSAYTPQFQPYPPFQTQPQPQRPSGKSDKVLWIGNLHQDVKDGELAQAFGQFGRVISVKLVHTKACGFVTFAEPSSAMDAHEKMGQFKFHGQEIKIGWGKADEVGQPAGDPAQRDGTLQQNLPDINRDLPPQPASRTLWVGNVTPALNETVLRGCFNRFGNIEYVRLWVSRHCAFITFANEQEASAAKMQMDRQRIADTIIRVNYGKA